MPCRELETHLQIEEDEQIARGMSPEAARHAARRKLGNRTHALEDVYRLNTIGAVDTLARDVRYGLRVMRRHPTYAVAAILTLALAVGANTTAFSVVDGVLLKPLPYPDAGFRCVRSWATASSRRHGDRVRVLRSRWRRRAIGATTA